MNMFVGTQFIYPNKQVFQIYSLEKLEQTIRIVEYKKKQTVKMQTKQNLNPKKSGKFQSFQNYRQDQFSAYKYERNTFISRGIGNNDVKNSSVPSLVHQDDEHDYIQPFSNGKMQIPDKDKTTNQKSQAIDHKQTDSENIQNLCDLWDQLGSDIQNQESNQKYNKQQIPPKCPTQLTQEELMACFGSQTQKQEESVQEKVSQTPNLQANKCLTSTAQLQYVKQLQPDEDLMDIWGEGSCQNLQGQQASKQQKMQPNNQDFLPLKPFKPIQQTKSTEQCIKSSIKITKQDNSSIQNLQRSDLRDIDQSYSCLSELDVQDPNHLKLMKTETTDQNQLIYDSKTIQAQNKKKQTLEAQSMPRQQQDYQAKKNDSYQNQSNTSIVQWILLQNNHKNMTKLIPGTDYKIFNNKLFVLQPFKTNSYSYFGIHTRKQSLLVLNQGSNPSKKLIKSQECGKTDLSSKLNDIFYLYSFQTSEAFIQLRPQRVNKQYLGMLAVQKTISIAPGQKVTKKFIEFNTQLCYKIRVCQTKEHIATLFLKSIKDGILYDLRFFDEYQQTHTSSIALIQVKDGYVSEFCYCDTNVFMANTTKPNAPSHIEKFKMILNIKSGELTANMGINGIESSPYNCCLQSQTSNKFIYLMGLLSSQNQGFNRCKLVRQHDQNQRNKQVRSQSQKQQPLNEPQECTLSGDGHKAANPKINTFIIKIGQGISPLVGLVISAARKLYIDSFE